MCGIVGIISQEQDNVFPLALEGLRSLEYRGYDSFGFASVSKGKIVAAKRVGAVSESDANSWGNSMSASTVIGHTRWATHGKVTEENSHPHVSCDGTVAIVHNGVIANYMQLISENQEWTLSSETDTEVAANLIAKEIKAHNDDLVPALVSAIAKMEGEFAICGTMKDHPNMLFAIKRKSPLAVGRVDGKVVFSSDRTAFGEVAENFELFQMEDGDIIVANLDKIERFSCKSGAAEEMDVALTPDSYKKSEDALGNYPHYMIKEIGETSVAARIMTTRMKDDVLDPLARAMLNRPNAYTTASGSAYYAGLHAQNFFHDLAGLFVAALPSDEFLNVKKLKAEDDLVIAVSQSGETFDTLEILREAQRVGVPIAAINNVESSTMQRMADYKIFQASGKEVCVLSTKSIISQLTALYLLALRTGEMKGHLDATEAENLRQENLLLPNALDSVIDSLGDELKRIAKKYCNIEHWFFIGRGIHYAVAMENALKFKEVSYLHAEGMAAGFFKHGTISLIDDHFYTVAFLPSKKTNKELFQATMDNINEIRARDGKVLGFGHDKLTDMERDMFMEYVQLPHVNNQLNALIQLVAGQILAYHCGVALDRNVDRPRALAKSVTVR